jgi:arginine decarboxylase-like protein
MTDAPDEPNDERLLFLQQLLEDRATIAADVFEVDPHTWAIHGVIPVGGDVIMAEFDTEDEAKKVLNQLAAPEHGPPAPEAS